MQTIQVPRGQRVVATVPIIDPSTGRLDARWLSTDTILARVWAGQERAHVSLSGAWDGDPGAVGAKIALTISDTVSADLADGRWPVDFQVVRSTVATAVGGCYLLVVPGTATANDDDEPRSYITGREFRDTCGPFVDTLQTKFGQTSNLQALALATKDLDDYIARRYAQTYRGGIDEATYYDDMIDRLEAGGLTVTEPVKRYVAYKALWHLAAWTPGGGDELERIRVRAEQESASALRSIVAYVDGQYVIPMAGATRLVR